MPNLHFRCMAWMFRLVDIFSRPERRLQRLPVRQGMIVADYGCGPGRYTVPLAGLVGPEGKVYAIDIQPLAAEMIRKNAARRSLSNIVPVLVDSYDTRIPGATVDIVLLLDTIQAISDPDALFREVHRILKPTGLLCMDCGHLKPEKARGMAENSCLFTVKEACNRDMVLNRNA